MDRYVVVIISTNPDSHLYVPAGHRSVLLNEAAANRVSACPRQHPSPFYVAIQAARSNAPHLGQLTIPIQIGLVIGTGFTGWAGRHRAAIPGRSGGRRRHGSKNRRREIWGRTAI